MADQATQAPTFATVAGVTGVDGPEASDLHALGLRREVLETSTLAIVEVDMERGIRYANPSAIRMLGAPAEYRGLSLDSVFVDNRSKQVVDRELERRRAGFIGNYRVTARRMSDRREIPVEITGLPITDERGEVVLGLGLFRSLEQQEFAEAIRQLSRPGQSPEELLAKLEENFRRVIRFDRMSVSRMSSDLNHIKAIYPTGAGTPAQRYRRWWALTEAQKQWYASASSSVIPDLDKFFEDPVWAPFKEEPAVKELLHAGIKSVLRRDVYREGRAVLSITLMSCELNGFGVEQQELFMSDAVGSCLLQAYELAETQRVSKRLNLLKSLNRCTRVDEACTTLATQLVDIFDWSHVSIFRVDPNAGTLRMLAQCWEEGDAVRLPAHYEQSVTKGILGRVVTTGECQNVSNVLTDRDYIRGVKSARVRSEMCVPVRPEGEADVRWIINVEDTQESAFASDESAALFEIAKEVGGLMQRIADLFFLMQCFEHASEAIFVTDAEMDLRRVNIAAAQLLGYKDKTKVTGNFCDFLQDRATCSRLRNPVDGDLGEFFLTQVGAKKKSSKRPVPTIPVHISRRDFPEGLTGSIFIAHDTRAMRHSVQSGILEKAAYSVAVETCTPLSAAIAELESIARESPGNADSTGRDAALSRVLRQLGRVRQGYLRLAMFNPEARPKASNFAPLNLQSELEALARNLTAGDRVQVEPGTAGPAPVIQGDHFQIGFVLETLLVAMLRHAPKDEPVVAGVTAGEGNVSVHLRGYLDGGLPAQQLDAQWVPSDADMAIAKPLLDEFVANHEGSWRGSVGKSRRAEIDLQFPRSG